MRERNACAATGRRRRVESPRTGAPDKYGAYRVRVTDRLSRGDPNQPGPCSVTHGRTPEYKKPHIQTFLKIAYPPLPQVTAVVRLPCPRRFRRQPRAAAHPPPCSRSSRESRASRAQELLFDRCRAQLRGPWCSLCNHHAMHSAHGAISMMVRPLDYPQLRAAAECAELCALSRAAARAAALPAEELA